MEEQIKQYVANGGRLFTIDFIDTIRDGGSKMIRCTNGDTFYIDKKNNRFHFGYPTSNNNLISDPLLISYLMDRIKSYVDNLNKEWERNNQLYIKLHDIHLFTCDICGEEKSGQKFPVVDENFNKQRGLNQCEDCYKIDLE